MSLLDVRAEEECGDNNANDDEEDGEEEEERPKLRGMLRERGRRDLAAARWSVPGVGGRRALADTPFSS